MGRNAAVLNDYIPSEHEEQREVVFWFRRKHRPMRIFSIPNGGWRSRATAARLKAEGVSKGVPDLFIPALNLWVEMKRSKDGRLSPDQKDWLKYLETECGHATLVCYGAEDAKMKIDAFMRRTMDDAD